MYRQKLVLLLLIGAVSVVAGCSSNAQPEEKGYVTTVRTVQVETGVAGLPIISSGRLAPKTTISLSFKTGGIVERIHVDEGMSVLAGTVLARLDLAEIEAQVQQARSTFEKARRDLERLRDLYADSVATLEQVQDTETAYTIARSDLEIAEFNRRHSEIVAPADGRIQRRHVEPNELVSPGQTIMQLGAAGRWVVRLGLSDRDVVKVGLGDAARLHFDAYPDQVFSGRVTELADAADPVSGTFEVEVSVDENPAVLKNGFIVGVELIPSDNRTLSFIPIESLVSGDGRSGTVYTVDGASGTARKVTIQIAELLDDRIAVSSGLESVTHVITDGAQYLSEGALVTVSDS